ncbi:DJ-1/PfpI family protein [Ferrimonas sediminum]|uniref:DJ-1/PfpI family protein n=1 Tax=Ferrimonas sediminum TaxID=718193 RepID=A0A1G8RWL4_9GAMM|nr:DJ-1/PfpI family protein [Ferrimonas sediminum]SDJ21327.1 DJ-1/PfpI family protein [Ferrimonas sediminum]
MTPCFDRSSAVTKATPMNVGIFLFPGMTMMDAYAPLQVLALSESFTVFTFAATTEPLACDAGVMLMPQYGFSNLPEIDVLLVPGGANPETQMQDPLVLAVLRKLGQRAKYVTSVCTGALILAQTGLLDGYRTTVHWAYSEALTRFPKVIHDDGRLVHDRNRISGGGITAGLDFALYLIGEIGGRSEGAAMELLLEYAPQPPFACGHPSQAPLPLRQALQEKVINMAKGLFD